MFFNFKIQIYQTLNNFTPSIVTDNIDWIVQKAMMLLSIIITTEFNIITILLASITTLVVVPIFYISLSCCINTNSRRFNATCRIFSGILFTTVSVLVIMFTTRINDKLQKISQDSIADPNRLFGMDPLGFKPNEPLNLIHKIKKCSANQEK